MNWASLTVGAQIVNYSSQVEGCEAVNVLDDEIGKIWLTDEQQGLPQWICISLEHVAVNHIQSLGWECWHPYSTNPHNVVVHVSRNGTQFKEWDILVVEHIKSGQHLFYTAQIDTKLYPFIAFEIRETFGRKQCYMNRIYLFSEEISASVSSSHTSFARNINSEGTDEVDSVAKQLEAALGITDGSPERKQLVESLDANATMEKFESLVSKVLNRDKGFDNLIPRTGHISDDDTESSGDAETLDKVVDGSNSEVGEKLMERSQGNVDLWMNKSFLMTRAPRAAGGDSGSWQSSQAPVLKSSESVWPPKALPSLQHLKETVAGASEPVRRVPASLVYSSADLDEVHGSIVQGYTARAPESSERRLLPADHIPTVPLPPEEQPAREVEDKERVAIVNDRLDQLDAKMNRILDVLASGTLERSTPLPAEPSIYSVTSRTSTASQQQLHVGFDHVNPKPLQSSIDHFQVVGSRARWNSEEDAPRSLTGSVNRPPLVPPPPPPTARSSESARDIPDPALGNTQGSNSLAVTEPLAYSSMRSPSFALHGSNITAQSLSRRDLDFSPELEKLKVEQSEIFGVIRNVEAMMKQVLDKIHGASSLPPPPSPLVHSIEGVGKAFPAEKDERKIASVTASVKANVSVQTEDERVDREIEFYRQKLGLRHEARVQPAEAEVVKISAESSTRAPPHDVRDDVSVDEEADKYRSRFASTRAALRNNGLAAAVLRGSRINIARAMNHVSVDEELDGSVAEKHPAYSSSIPMRRWQRETSGKRQHVDEEEVLYRKRAEPPSVESNYQRLLEKHRKMEQDLESMKKLMRASSENHSKLFTGHASKDDHCDHEAADEEIAVLDKSVLDLLENKYVLRSEQRRREERDETRKEEQLRESLNESPRRKREKHRGSEEKDAMRRSKSRSPSKRMLPVGKEVIINGARYVKMDDLLSSERLKDAAPVKDLVEQLGSKLMQRQVRKAQLDLLDQMKR